MDSRLADTALFLTGIGLVQFWFLAGQSIQQNSPSTYTASILLMGLLFASALAFSASALPRKRAVGPTHLSLLLVGSSILGAGLGWLEWFSLILSSRIFGPPDCTPYLCDLLLGVPQYVVIPIFAAVGCATSIVMFVGSITAFSKKAVDAGSRTTAPPLNYMSYQKELDRRRLAIKNHLGLEAFHAGPPSYQGRVPKFRYQEEWKAAEAKFLATRTERTDILSTVARKGWEDWIEKTC